MTRILSLGEHLKDGIKPELIRTSGEIELNKPRYGLYGSTLIRNSYYGPIWSSWGDFVVDYKSKFFSVGVSYTLYKKAKIYTVDNLKSYLNLLDKFPRTDRLNRVSIDWDKFAKEYDAFHLTLDAFLDLRILNLNYRNKNREIADFYSYDCETWIVFNPEVINLGSQQLVTIPYLKNIEEDDEFDK